MFQPWESKEKSLLSAGSPAPPYCTAPVKKIPAEIQGLMGFNKGINRGGLPGFARSRAAIPGSQQREAGEGPRRSAMCSFP